MSSKLRSVVDLDSEDALRKALMTVRLPGDTNGARAVERGGTTPPETGGGNGEAEEMDWILPSCDPETTEAQSMREELHRLTCLKNYLILDSEKEEVFDRLTRLGARLFNVPLAIISLVDLGRQWFLSNRGLGEAREMPRKHAFCAHTILNKHNMLIVTDTTKDFRFKNNPVVLGPPNVRFYAGAVSTINTVRLIGKLFYVRIMPHILFFMALLFSLSCLQRGTSWAHFVFWTTRHVRPGSRRKNRDLFATWPIWPFVRLWIAAKKCETSNVRKS